MKKRKPIFSIISLLLSIISIFNFYLLIPFPFDPPDILLGNFPALTALIGTALSIFALIYKEPFYLSLIGLIINGLSLLNFILIIIFMFLSFVVGI
ncbi:hypothetical protein CJ195_03770 [Bacillus sp. UMB0899]|uniref:hypothetical protein n=1 Tax=Metabacillus schmidteae TaxID=2730405 RepID=UPI000C7FE018|nr:hypothetical protein [Metabacillus schmidteae]PMC39068.1 hypothetical protein CJ195_03770 [Bacillus sp. UMB0899]